MGNAAALFYSLHDSAKQTLHRRITPSEEQFEQQQDRWNALAEHLITDLRQKSGCTIRTWLQGSYKFATQIRPPRMGEEFDIDLGIFFCWGGLPENGIHSPTDLRSMTQASLAEYSEGNDAVKALTKPPKPRCSRIHYDGNFHIDVPCYHLDTQAENRTLASKFGWETSDPKAFYVWFKETIAESARPRVRRLIRYLKCWAGLKWNIGAGRPSSVLLTVLVAEAFIYLSEDEIGADDDTLRAVLKRMNARAQKMTVIKNPVNSTEDLNRLSESEWVDFRAGLAEFLEIAGKACEAESEVAAADEWSQAFRQFFPMPETSTINEAVSLAKADAPVISNLPDVLVTAKSRINPNVNFSGRNAIGPIPKDCDIEFQINDPWKLPSGVTVNWIVRNEGSEAEDINDLGHLAGTGYTASERSAYVGKHFMDCVLRYKGRAFAVRRVAVTVGGAIVAPRNPPKRPAYTRLAGRR
jgi:hypothetical protein